MYQAADKIRVAIHLGVPAIEVDLRFDEWMVIRNAHQHCCSLFHNHRLCS